MFWGLIRRKEEETIAAIDDHFFRMRERCIERIERNATKVSCANCDGRRTCLWRLSVINAILFGAGDGYYVMFPPTDENLERLIGITDATLSFVCRHFTADKEKAAGFVTVPGRCRRDIDAGEMCYREDFEDRSGSRRAGCGLCRRERTDDRRRAGDTGQGGSAIGGMR